MSGLLFLVTVIAAVVVVLWLVQNEGDEGGHRGILLGMRGSRENAARSNSERRNWRRRRDLEQETPRWRRPDRR